MTINKNIKAGISILYIFLLIFLPEGLVSLANADSTPPALADLWVNKAWLEFEPRAHGNFGDGFMMHFPDFIKVGDEIWAYYIDNKDGKLVTGLAKSKDGITFNKHGVVLDVSSEQSWDDRMTSFPSIWHDEDVFYLVYESAGTGDYGSISLAISTDGINFEKKGIILDKEKEGWESINVGTPDLYKYGDTWYLTYHGYDGLKCQIGIAYGKDLFELEKHPENPIIPAGSSGDFNEGTTGRRDIIYQNGYYYMAYETSTAPPYESAAWSFTLARSKDMLNWETLPQENPVVKTQNRFGNDGPAFLEIEGEIFIYYRVWGNILRRAKLVNENSKTQSLSIYEGPEIKWKKEDSNIESKFDIYLIDFLESRNITFYKNEMVAVFTLRLEEAAEKDTDILTLKAVDSRNGDVLEERIISSDDFKRKGESEIFYLPFFNAERAENIILTIVWHEKINVSFVKIYLNSYTNAMTSNKSANSMSSDDISDISEASGSGDIISTDLEYQPDDKKYKNPEEPFYILAGVLIIVAFFLFVFGSKNKLNFKRGKK